MLDFGLIDSKDMNDYETKYLTELSPGDEITGEIVVGEFKTMPIGKREVAEFYIIITDIKNRTKWVCEFTTPYYPETDNIYGKNGDVFYNLIDSLNHVVNKTPLNWHDNYSVNFSRFRQTVNKCVNSVTVKALQPDNPDAKTVNLQILYANVITEPEINPPVSIYELAQEDPILLMAYAHLRNKGSRITVENITFELKASFDDEKITEQGYHSALHVLKKVKDGV